MDGEGRSGAVANPEAEVETVEEGAGLETGMEVERSCTFSLLPISFSLKAARGLDGPLRLQSHSLPQCSHQCVWCGCIANAPSSR